MGEKAIIFCAVLCAIVILSNGNEVPRILKYTNNQNGYGRYSFAYETSDGIKRSEEGGILPEKTGSNERFVVRGEYSYIGTDGLLYAVKYIADENGFQPIGNHLLGTKHLKVTDDIRYNDRRQI